MKKTYLFSLIICISATLNIFQSTAQNIDLENVGGQVTEALKKNPFKISGGISASGIYYNTNAENNTREPFTYFLSGNLNLGIYQWSIPVSYTFTNQGSALGYQLPFKFNRISIHPKYKWIQTHIGDVSMSFSPYTFSGVPFTGAGVELTPNIPLKVAVFGGQFTKAVKDNGDPRTIPAFQRYGYGIHLRWEKPRYKLGAIGFYAKDNPNSLDSVPYSKQIFPQENMVLSFNASVLVTKSIEFFGEFARTGITQDLTCQTPQKSKDPLAWFLKENGTTEFFNAFNAGINWNITIGQIGIKYERIDPNYKTLGAYYFNNDFENITLNANFSLFGGKLSIGGNGGRQRDNLNSDKQKQTDRWVGSVNLSWQASDRLSIAGNYSNFTTFTNNQLNQFTNINQNPLDVQQPLDSINYKQISQNAGANIMFVLSKSEKTPQNLNITYSLSDMVNRENNVVHTGGLSRFHNAAISHNIKFQKIKLGITTSVNYTNSYAATQTMHIFGPSLSMTHTLLQDKLQLMLGGSYNRTVNPTANIDVTNLRLGATYSPWKRHTFNATAIQMFRSSTQGVTKNLNELTAQVGYAFSF